MAAKKRNITVQKGTLQDSDRMSDLFWDAVPPHEKLAAVWPLVCDFAQWSNTDAGESRLQRSVLRIERR